MNWKFRTVVMSMKNLVRYSQTCCFGQKSISGTGIFIAIIDIKTCELKEGNLPKKQLKLVLAWAEIRQEELLADWMLAINSELPYKIDPLR
jgi:hypothetical protein